LPAWSGCNSRPPGLESWKLLLVSHGGAFRCLPMLHNLEITGMLPQRRAPSSEPRGPPPAAAAQRAPTLATAAPDRRLGRASGHGAQRVRRLPLGLRASDCSLRIYSAPSPSCDGSRDPVGWALRLAAGGTGCPRLAAAALAPRALARARKPPPGQGRRTEE
jgi:hypothetical protein